MSEIAPVFTSAIPADARTPVRPSHGPDAQRRREGGGAHDPPAGPAPASGAGEAERRAAHAAAEATLAARQERVRVGLGALDRSLAQLTAQSADLSMRVSGLLAPGQAIAPGA